MHLSASAAFIKGRGTGFGQLPWAATNTLEEYYANSNERLMVIPQCETKEALEQIEEIAAMEGIDGIFIGPFDLSTSMGLPGRFTHPDFLAAKARILKACKKKTNLAISLRPNPKKPQPA